ncbi:DUF2203 domain-containing protein [Paenibacillus sp. LHD-117]|uniref:DUF2203 domain-containing protein n=1 Tax=Paenibacillus sp. LHD-117 TaxID=3071412 RepID=UPI0027E0DDF1|nr:DUF2203 domain-containing protein [Paenibacillus sp. LHD-117]MDQ6420530.1 DUF2203 domain-containing protein [Paenibacillus sp. LHD-117]
MMTRRFSLAEANALLPEVQRNLKQLQELSEKLEEQYIHYRKVKAGHGEQSGELLFEMESQMDFKQMELQIYMQNFARQGVLLKMIQPGLIDFPAIMDGEEVLLCWKEGEERITQYHGWHDGFGGRKPHPDA